KRAAAMVANDAGGMFRVYRAGVEQGSFGVNKLGSDLSLKNAAGQRIAWLTCSPAGGELFVFNNASTAVTGIGVSARGDADIVLHNHEGKDMIHLGLPTNSTRALLLMNDVATGATTQFPP